MISSIRHSVTWELRGVDDERGEDEVGGEGDDVGGLAVRLDALDEHERDQRPAAGQAQHQLPAQSAVVLQVVRAAFLVCREGGIREFSKFKGFC